MCDKYPDQGSSNKPIPLSSYEMRKVLEEVQEERIVQEDRLESLEEPEDDSEFSRVLAEMPDLEGDYGDLTLGFNEELCFGPAVGDDGKSKSVSVSTEKKEVAIPPLEDRIAVPDVDDVKEEGEPSDTAAQTGQAVPIHKGDLIEFMISDRTWFLVEVTGRGKLGGKNQNYLNVKYSDGSEGGVYIDKHQWRIVKRKDLTMEDSPDHSLQPTIRLHRVTVDLPPTEEFSTETETTTTDTDDCGLTDQEKQKVGHTRKRKRSRRKRDKERKSSVEDDPTSSISSIKKGDRIEYIVKEEDGKGKSSGRNKNYLNVRYADGSVGGVFINKHQWSFLTKSESMASSNTDNK